MGLSIKVWLPDTFPRPHIREALLVSDAILAFSKEEPSHVCPEPGAGVQPVVAPEDVWIVVF